jgi:hypothetical protein
MITVQSSVATCQNIFYCTYFGSRYYNMRLFYQNKFEDPNDTTITARLRSRYATQTSQ